MIIAAPRSSPPRALFLTTQVAGHGGIQYAGRLFARALADLLGPTAQMTLIAVADTPAALAALEPLSGWHYYGAGGSKVRAGLQSLWAGAGQPWDLVLLGHLHLAALTLAARRRPAAALVGVVYSLEAWRPIQGLRRRALQRFQKLLFISEHSRELAYRANPWLRAVPSAVCHLGLLPGDEQPSDRSAKNADPGLPRPSGRFALSVGRMLAVERHKGHEELIRAWPQVNQRQPDLSLVLIGDGDDRPRLEAIAREQRARVRFLGSVDNATRDAYLQACQCFCLPSRAEGFGLVFLEAMRAGKPVVAGSTDAGREVIEDRVTGRTVNPDDQTALVKAILCVAGPDGHRLGAAAQTRFAQSFAYAPFLGRFAGSLGQASALPPLIQPRPLNLAAQQS